MENVTWYGNPVDVDQEKSVYLIDSSFLDGREDLVDELVLTRAV